ncbi:PREDICTED: uncharacterized protein LOC108365583 [Rhagoletis zephyria]|uniref:uncharacterized protein LOC108365583 n=1 Tax=Rhagoletis zephyria TaxID=28612 RepID=UPI0008117431|nr:PREDICTED: uncharacterized protein LOC108365583 [Rhagoletis zephyria]XP_036325610.1 uncharacterized protein LOC118738759 isoform X1 [Rhagoletis pomonella]
MKIQFLVLIISVYLVHSTKACNTPEDRQLCDTLTQRCRATAANRPGVNPDDTFATFNTQCRVRVGATWRNVAYCDMVRAICQLTLLRCQKTTCRNVQAII